MTKAEFIQKVIELSGAEIDTAFLDKLKNGDEYVIEDEGLVYIADFVYSISPTGFGNFQVAIFNKEVAESHYQNVGIERAVVAEGDKLWLTISGDNNVGRNILAMPLSGYTGGSIGPVQTTNPTPPTPDVTPTQNVTSNIGVGQKKYINQLNPDRIVAGTPNNNHAGIESGTGAIVGVSVGKTIITYVDAQNQPVETLTLNVMDTEQPLQSWESETPPVVEKTSTVAVGSNVVIEPNNPAQIARTLAEPNGLISWSPDTYTATGVSEGSCVLTHYNKDSQPIERITITVTA